MADFLNQAWFWTAFFVAATSLCALLIREWFWLRNQSRIERLKLYDSDIFAAHKSLYAFASTMEMQFSPPGDTRKDFIALMKNDFYKLVKPTILLFSPEIRRILHDFVAQYHCLGDPDLIPRVPFDDFVDKELYERLNELETLVEKRMDSVFHELR